MYIGIAAVVLSCVLCLGAYLYSPLGYSEFGADRHVPTYVVARQMLIQQNKRLSAASSESEALEEANRQRIEDAAMLEGISVEEAVEKKKGFRYLY